MQKVAVRVDSKRRRRLALFMQNNNRFDAENWANCTCREMFGPDSPSCPHHHPRAYARRNAEHRAPWKHRVPVSGVEVKYGTSSPTYHGKHLPDGHVVPLMDMPAWVTA